MFTSAMHFVYLDSHNELHGNRMSEQRHVQRDRRKCGVRLRRRLHRNSV